MKILVDGKEIKFSELNQAVDRSKDLMILGHNGWYDYKHLVSATENFYDKQRVAEKYGMLHLAKGGQLIVISSEKRYDDSEVFVDELELIRTGADISLVEPTQIFIFNDINEFVGFR